MPTEQPNDDELDDIEPDDDDNDEPDEDEQKFDVARAKATIRAQRRSERATQKKLAEAQKELDTLRAASEDSGKEKTAAEKLERDLRKANERAERAEGELRKASLRTTCLEEASKLKFRNPALAARLVDSDDIEFDDDGVPDRQSVKEALREVLREDPSLKVRARREDDDEDEDAEDADAGAGRRRRRTSGFDSEINSTLRSMAGKR